MGVKINTNAGTGPQEVINAKRSIAQLESAIAVKRGHWHLYGEFTADGIERIDFGEKVSAYAVVCPELHEEITVEVLTLPAGSSGGYVANIDGFMFSSEGTHAMSGIGTIFAAGGISSVEIGAAVEPVTVSIYIID